MNQESYGLYPFFPNDDKTLIHPEDYSQFVTFLPYGKVLRKQAEQEGYLFLSYGKKIFRVKPLLFRPLAKSPLFWIGDRVQIKKYPDAFALIQEVHWHDKNQEFLFFLSIGKKISSRRYLTKELQFFRKTQES